MEKLGNILQPHNFRNRSNLLREEMSDELRLNVNAVNINHTSESQTIINNHDLDVLGVAEDEVLLNELSEIEIMDQSNTTRDLADEEKPRTKIQRVPEIMLKYKKFNKFYYKPSELSIGPIHADSNNLVKKKLKIKLAARFVKESGKNGEALLGVIKAYVEELKKYFDERIIKSYTDESLSRLLFLDGCSMLQFIKCYLSDGLKDFNITNGEAMLIQHDLLLVENQIPFLVLKLLMDSCDPLIRKMLRENVLTFVLTNAPIGDLKYTSDLLSLVDAEDRVHLLDLLRAVLLFEDYEDQRDSVSCDNISQSRDRSCFFPCFRRNKPFFSDNNNTILRKMYRDGELYPSIKRSFRNVQELKLAGIKLKPSTSCSLKAISFTTKCFIAGQLELPTLIVDNSTAPKFLNLVAYEMCLPNYKTNCVVTSYVNFLDLLIDSEQDVKDLRAAYVLRNRLSCDAEVAQLFNSIGYNCLRAPKDAYLNVKNEIQKHYQRKIAIWVAQVYTDQFKSPWTVIALLAAAIALILTAIQTWYAVHPKRN